jgi:hercynine metabolism protein
MSWLDDLEARLDSQLQDVLRTNPEQEALLAEQERRDRQESLKRQRLRLQAEAERARAALLALASEIRCWQERVEKARRAGADDLASRAEAHVSALMEQGRQRWQALGELGQRFNAVEWELSELERQGSGSGPAATAQASGAPSEGNTSTTTAGGPDLQDAWAAFEAQQELEALKQRLRR